MDTNNPTQTVHPAPPLATVHGENSLLHLTHVVIKQTSSQLDAPWIVTVAATRQFLAPSLVVTLPMGPLTLSAAVIHGPAAGAPAELNVRLPQRLAMFAALGATKEIRSKVAEPFLVLPNEVDFCLIESGCPIDSPVFVEEGFGEVNGLGTPRIVGSAQLLVGEEEFSAALSPLFYDLIHATLLEGIGKSGAASPLFGGVVREHGDELVKSRRRFGSCRMRLGQLLFAFTVDFLQLEIEILRCGIV